MSSQEPGIPPPSPATQQWFARLGNSGKLMAIGGVAGIIATLLPLASVSVDMLGIASTSGSSMVIDSWQGKICLAGYIIAVALSFVLYSPGGLTQKNMGWAGLATGALTALFAIILIVRAFQATSNSRVMSISREPEADNAGGDEPDAYEPDRRCRFVEHGQSDKECPDGADTGPHGIGRPHRDRTLRDQ